MIINVLSSPVVFKDSFCSFQCYLFFTWNSGWFFAESVGHGSRKKIIEIKAGNIGCSFSTFSVDGGHKMR